MKRLPLLILLAGGVFAFLHHDAFFATHGSGRDKIILAFIATVYGLVAVMMLGFTRLWTWRGLGLLATITADALLYATFFFAKIGHPLGWQSTILDLIRALLIVGGSFVLLGMADWVREEWITPEQDTRQKGHDTSGEGAS